MTDILLRRVGRAGRATLHRPEALNALSHEMCKALDSALITWAADPAVDLVVIDAAGPKAFCAGGDIVDLYMQGTAGNFAFGQSFWRDEYRMNDRIGRFPKPVVVMIQGFCMGGGVGIACHASHRIVTDSTQIAMPECAIGLVPDVGGSALLARAPGHLGAYLGMTGKRMGAADAIYAGFADLFVPESNWPALIATLCETGDVAAVGRANCPPPEPAALPALQDQIDRHFGAAALETLSVSLATDDSEFARTALKMLSRAAPLAAAVTLAMQQRLGAAPALRDALELEYRVTFRAQSQTDFLEGIRALIIDKDRTPRWRHTGVVPVTEIAALLAPLGQDTLTFPTTTDTE